MSKKIAPIRLLSIAPSQYGKTYQVVQWLCDLISKKEWSEKRVLIFSPTAKTDDSMLKLVTVCEQKYPKFRETNMFEAIDEQLIDWLYETQKEIKEINPKKLKQYLLIIDDSLTDDALHKKHSPMLKIATSGRHFGISTCVLLQKFRAGQNSVIRSQTSCLMLGRLNSLSEVLDIAEEYSMGLAKNKKECVQKFLDLAEECWKTNDNHGFIVVWPYKQMGQGRLQKNLDGQYLDK